MKVGNTHRFGRSLSHVSFYVIQHPLVYEDNTPCITIGPMSSYEGAIISYYYLLIITVVTLLLFVFMI